MQEGQDQDFDNDSGGQPEFNSAEIGNKATPEYFSNVEGGKKNKEKVTNKRSRFTRKTLLIILGAVIAVVLIFVTLFLVINLRSRTIGKRTDEEFPTTMTEVRRRAYKVASESGRYYSGIVYLKDLILDMQDSGIDQDFIFEVKIFLARFIYEAGDTDAAIYFLEGLESRESVTDMQKYLLYGAIIDIYKSENNAEKVKEYLELSERLDPESGMDFSEPLGGAIDE